MLANGADATELGAAGGELVEADGDNSARALPVPGAGMTCSPRSISARKCNHTAC